jgi:leukotriene-A4 hydrolase
MWKLSLLLKNVSLEKKEKSPGNNFVLFFFWMCILAVFLEKLSDLPSLPHKSLQVMDGYYQWTSVRNSEIRFRWQMVCLKANYEPIYPHVVAFVTEQGRMKFVRPLYRQLNMAVNGADLAKSTFLEHKAFYHPIAAQLIIKDLGL